MYLVSVCCTIWAFLATVHAGNGNIANKYFLEKEKFLLELLLRVEEPLLEQEWIRTGAELVLDKDEYVEYNEAMTDFYAQHKNKQLLPHGQQFSALLPDHAQQAAGLYNFLYYARDWESLRTNLCWARQHVNTGMFLHAVTQMFIKRADFNGLILPKIYELLPQHFFNSKFVRAAESFDFALWSRAKMLEAPQHAQKQQNGLSVCKHCWPWQWWRYMALSEAVYAAEDKHMLGTSLINLRNSSKWRQAMDDVKILWMPVDYTRDLQPTAVESKLTYLTEDVNWNSYWYYLNMGLSGNKAGTDVDATAKEKLREWWFFQLRQLLARYKLERAAQGLTAKSSFEYEPHMISYNGARLRKLTDKNDHMLNIINRQLQRVQQALGAQSFILSSGEELPFDSTDNLNRIMDDIFDNMLAQALTHLAVATQHMLLHHWETMLREPAFYVYAEKLLQIYWLLRSTMLSYSAHDFTLPGVKIERVHVSPLATHFELVDTDVSNLLSNKMFYYDGQLLREKALLARQHRLSHKPFRLLFNITAERQQPVIVRTFLGPRLGVAAAFDWRSYFQLDTFLYNLEPGNQLIHRRSIHFLGTIRDHPSHTELYRLVQLAQNGGFDFPLNISTPYCGFPQRLLLPRGWESGLPLQMFFIVTTFDDTAQHTAYNMDCNFANGVVSYDDLPYGFPYDRPVELQEFMVPNAYVVPVKIYHVERHRKRF